MSSEVSVSFSSRAAEQLAGLTSKRTVSKILARISSLGTFPRAGLVDDLVPTNGQAERRVTYVSPWAIRYTYSPAKADLRIDSITDERQDSLYRFL